ncbi:MAG: transcriptional activator domain, partial [Chloroflexi bacterium]|nr:transcriptional activator domain [Chloroflexota bacterium]
MLLLYRIVGHFIFGYTLFMLEVRLFGIPKIILDQKLLKLPRRKARALLYYLAAQDGTTPREKLLGLFWPDEPRASAQQVLRTTLHSLRQALGDLLVTQDVFVSLDDSVRVDTKMFEAGLAGLQFDPEHWGETLRMYRGDFLEEVDLPDNPLFEDWVIIERERFRRMAVRALTALSNWYEARQEYGQALTFLDQALSSNPLQEDLQRESIRLHYLAGDRPGAIRRYDELRRLLDREMGVPPMVETRALYDAILNDRLPPGRPSADKRSSRLQSKPGELVTSNRQRRSSQELKLPFSGRLGELKLIQEGIRGNRLVFIEGEPGIGKTRLINEYLFGLNKMLIIKCRAHELEQNLPYQPIIEALRALVDHPDWNYLLPHIQREVFPVWRAEIGRLLPEQPELVQGAVNSAIGVDEARLWEGIYQFLSTVSSHRPFIIFIDDIHWADNSSIGLLGYLVRQKYPGTVGFVAAARPFSARSILMSLIQALIRDGLITRIHLIRLSQDDVQTIVAGIPLANSDQKADWLYQTSEGNPFILSELVRSMREAGIDGSNLPGSNLPDARQRSSDVTPVPKSVYSLIQARFTQLSEPARRVLDTSVAAGREFDFQVILQASGLSEAATVDAIDELVTAGLIIPQDSFRFSFDHHLTMEVALREVSELRHRLLHRRVAEALENIYREQLAEYAGLLAWHFQEGNAPDRAAPYAFQSGKQAARLAAWN